MAAKSHTTKDEEEVNLGREEDDQKNLSTDGPLSEKDEVKEAEKRTNKNTKEDA